MACGSGHLADSPRAPDVVICGYELRAEETGVGVIEAVRNEFNADIPGLLLTGTTDPAEIRKMAASGLAVLQKPLRKEQLNEAIRALCAPRALMLG